MMLSLILLGVLLNAGAQLSLKAGMTQIGHFHFTWENALPVGLQVASNYFILVGLFAYVASVVVWLLVLSRVEVSYAYPLLSIGYIVTALAAYFFFHEDLTWTRILGILIICLGVVLVTRTA